MKKLLLALTLALPACLFAQTKVGVVNADEILNLLPETAAAKEQLHAISETYQAENTKLEEEINKKIQEYQALPAETPASIRERRQYEIQDLDQRFQAFLQNAQQDLETQRQLLMQPATDKLAEAIKAIGAEQGFSIILPAGTPFYIGLDIIDLTEPLKIRLGISETPAEE